MEVEFDDRDMQIADRLHCTVFGDIYLTPTWRNYFTCWPHSGKPIRYIMHACIFFVHGPVEQQDKSRLVRKKKGGGEEKLIFFDDGLAFRIDWSGHSVPMLEGEALWLFGSCLSSRQLSSIQSHFWIWWIIDFIDWHRILSFFFFPCRISHRTPSAFSSWSVETHQPDFCYPTHPAAPCTHPPLFFPRSFFFFLYLRLDMLNRPTWSITGPSKFETSSDRF